jgi:hypothetical protein
MIALPKATKATEPFRATNPTCCLISGDDLSRKLAPDQRFSTFDYRNRAKGSMVPGEVQRHHLSVKQMHQITKAKRARLVVGTLTDKMSNHFSSAGFHTIANPLHKKDIQNHSFGI